ncbi:MAG: sulfatase [Bacteroidales bacterium]
MKFAITFFATVLLTVSSCQQRTPEKPNVLFILVDDLGYHDLGFTGSEYYETPNIDRLAAESMVFTQGYATCQVCSPSRASIMSGKSPARHGITDWIGAKTGEDWRKAGRFNKLLPPENGDHLPHAYTTLPEAMKEAGYATFYAGKWHIGGEGSLPTDHGFDINQGGFHAGGPYTGGFFSPFNNPKMEDYEGEKGMSLPMKLAQETEKFIREHKDAPFFAFLSFYAVHAPIQTTEEKWAKYRDKAEEMGIAEPGFEMKKFLPMRVVQDNPVYAGLVEMTDDAVGHVLELLEELGLAENTIVIFTSDNGGVSAGDAFATSNLPLRGGKGYQFEGGIREPYFIKVPWLGLAGKSSSVPATGTDFYPTILELTGKELRPNEHLDGISLVPALRGEAIPDRPLYWHYPHYGNQGGEPSSIIRLGDWKLIHYYEDDRVELYNLASDGEEHNDVAADHPALVSQLHEQLFGYLDAVGAKFPVHDPLYDEALEEAYLVKVHNVRLPQLEAQRMKFLSKDFDPGNNWWGSEVERTIQK